MEILEIQIENPIDFEGFQTLKSKVENSIHHNFLLIDFGNHDFKSIAVIKHFKEGLKSIESSLLKYKRIAFIHPPQFRNESTIPNIFNYFTYGEI